MKRYFNKCTFENENVVFSKRRTQSTKGVWHFSKTVSTEILNRHKREARRLLRDHPFYKDQVLQCDEESIIELTQHLEKVCMAFSLKSEGLLISYEDLESATTFTGDQTLNQYIESFLCVATQVIQNPNNVSQLPKTTETKDYFVVHDKVFSALGHVDHFGMLSLCAESLLNK